MLIMRCTGTVKVMFRPAPSVIVRFVGAIVEVGVGTGVGGGVEVGATVGVGVDDEVGSGV